jgi:hypothetical protein
MTFFRSSSAAVSFEKNLEQNTLLLKDIAAVRSDSPFACLRVGTLLPLNALVFTYRVTSRVVGYPEVILGPTPRHILRQVLIRRLTGMWLLPIADRRLPVYWTLRIFGDGNGANLSSLNLERALYLRTDFDFFRMGQRRWRWRRVSGGYFIGYTTLKH